MKALVLNAINDLCYKEVDTPKVQMGGGRMFYLK